MNKQMLVIMAALSLTASTLYATVPVVTNVVAVQRAGVKVIDIHYDAFDADGDLLKVRVEVSHSAGATYSVPAFSLSGDIGQRIAPGAGKHIVWNAGIDWDGEYSDIMRIKVIVSDGKGLPGLEWGYEVPPGGFMMGQDGGVEGIGPARHVNIPWSYWLSKYEITVQQYVDYLNMALITGEVYRDGTTIKANGGIYTGLSAGALLITIDTSRDIVWNVNNLEINSNRTNFPVNVTWYGAVAFAQHYGYDLPTEAEWEKAARGPDHDGLEEHQVYPWGNSLDGGKANYYNSGDPYQGGSIVRGCSPVGYYNGNQVPFGTNMVNAYGLYDMSGNMSEWCRSTVAATVESYPQLESLTNSLHKLDSAAKRILRGGGWGSGYTASGAGVNPPTASLQCYYRNSSEQNTDYPNNHSWSGSSAIRDLGFRVIRRSLSIQPSEASLPSLNNTQVFKAEGGVPSYAWSVSNTKGSVNPATGNATTYTRLSAGTNYVTCTDAAGLTATARIIQP